MTSPRVTLTAKMSVHIVVASESGFKKKNTHFTVAGDEQDTMKILN